MVVISRERQVQAQRSMILVFFLQGFVVAAIIPRVPDIIRNIDVTFAHWGVISAFGAVGSAAGLFLSNRVVQRFGVKHVTMTAFGLVGIGTASYGWIIDSTVYLVANVLVSMSMSVFIVAVNSQTVVLQTLSGRVIIGRFHAAWSAGAGFSALISGFLATVLPVGIHLTLFTVIGLSPFYVIVHKLLNRDEEAIAGANSVDKDVRWRHMPKRVYLLGIGLAVGVFPELAMWDWSSVYGRDVLGFDPTRAAMPYACFALAMITGRSLIDVIGRTIHLSQQAAFGGALSAIAMTVSILVGPGIVAHDPTLGLVVIGALWALAGLGTAAMAPAFLSSASIVSGMSVSAALTRMSVMQTVVIFTMKWLMGQTAESSGIDRAYWLTVVTWAIAAVLAAVVMRLTRRHHAGQVSSN